MKKIIREHIYSSLITDLASLIEQGRKVAVRYVNTALVATYWLIGRRIVEYEQKGKERAEYGRSLLKKISADLTQTLAKALLRGILSICDNSILLIQRFRTQRVRN